jgi:chromosome segregation ATPase
MTTEERIARLESQIERLEQREVELRKQMAAAQLDQWYARIEDLEVQARLGAMETSDRVHELLEQTRSRWQEAKTQLTKPTEVASEVFDSVRSSIDDLFKDVRKALVDAKDKARR